MKFIHAADIHLDSPLTGLRAYAGAPVEAMRAATRRALERMVDLALEEAVDFVVIAGDLYDGDWRDFNTGLFLVRQAARLTGAGIPLFVIHGNHDAASEITRALPLPAGLHVFPSNRATTDRTTLAPLRVAIHGQSFPRRAVTDNLARAYPPPVEGWFNIGLLHTALDGRDGHDPYAPCSLADLTGRGYDYWALGHVHGREILHEYPHIVFPGNLQSRHIRETGAKGCTLVTVEAGRVVAVAHRPVDVLRWAPLSVDLTGADTAAAGLDAIRAGIGGLIAKAEGRTLALRLTLTGRTGLHGQLAGRYEEWENDIRALALGWAAEAPWIETISVATRPERPLSGDGGDLLATLIKDITADAEQAPEEIFAVLGDLLAKLPPEMRDMPEFATPAGRAALMAQAVALALSDMQDHAA